MPAPATPPNTTTLGNSGNMGSNYSAIPARNGSSGTIGGGSNYSAIPGKTGGIVRTPSQTNVGTSPQTPPNQGGKKKFF